MPTAPTTITIATATTMSIERPDRLLYLLQVANASFPTGAFNHSYGFETWIDSGTLDDAASFGSACRDWLRYAAAPTDGAAIAHAHRRAAGGDLDGLVDLDCIVGALKLSRESREASFKTGRALLGAYRDVFSDEPLAPFAAAVREGRCEGHQAVIFGAAAEAQGIGAEDSVLAFLHAALSNLVSVGARLIPLGQIESQRIVREAWPLLRQGTEDACAAELDSLGSATAGLDVASMRHERLHTRLCMS